LSKDIQIKYVDPELHREFKAACSHFGLSMKRVLVKHMQNIVNDYRISVMNENMTKMSKDKWGRK